MFTRALFIKNNGIINKAMKRILLFILLLMAVLPGWAQRGPSVGKGRKETVAVGLRLGGNLSRYQYSGDYSLDALPLDSLCRRIRPVAGVNVEIPFAKVLYVAPEVTFVGRGDSRLYKSNVVDTLVRHQTKTNYLEFRLPLSLAFPITKEVKPYVFVSPSIGLTLPWGKIEQYAFDTLSHFHYATEIDSSNMALYDVGVTVGAGMRYTKHFEAFSLVFKAEVGWYQGMRDTYSPMEHIDQALAHNVGAYNINGKRKNKGFEASFTVSLPLRFYRDACFFGPRY